MAECGATSCLSRPLRATAYLLLALFSLGHLGVSARLCSISGCGRPLGFLVSVGAISAPIALLVAIVLFTTVFHYLECAAAFILLVWWSVALGICMHLTEIPGAPSFVHAMAAFAWVAETIVLILFASAALDVAAMNTKSAMDGAHETRQADRERDAVAEERYMDAAATGDINYVSTNLVRNTLPYPD
eukprot:IDg17052t1